MIPDGTFLMFSFCASRFTRHGRGSPNFRIARRLQVMLPKFWQRKFARGIGVQMPWAVSARQTLLTNSLLQGHESMEQRLWPGRTPRDMHVHRQIPVDPLQHIVTLLERTS